MKIGHARVSTRKQTLEARLSWLADADCETFFEGLIPGAKGRRPRLEAMPGRPRKDDVVMVTRPDRLARPKVGPLRISEVPLESGAGNAVP